MTITLSQDQMKVLERLSSIYLWWENPEKTTETQPLRVLAQVMNLGTWEDWNVMLRNFDKNILKDVLKSAKKDGLMKTDCISGTSTWDSVSIVMKFHHFLRIVPLPNGKFLAIYERI